MTDAPRDDIVRALTEPAVLRMAADGGGRTLHGHFAVFNEWTEIDSLREGHFMERMAPGAFADTIRSVDRIKVLYDHGKDPQMGNKPLGQIISLQEDDHGVAYEVKLLRAWETDAPWLIEAADAGLLGSSFRFGIDDDKWEIPRTPTVDNPKRLKERTVTKAHVREFGPVTFPQYAGATAMVRSATDEYFDSLHDPLFVARLTADRGLAFVEHLLASEPAVRPDTPLPPAAQRDDTEQAPSDGTAGGQPERTYPTDLESRQMRARQIEAYRMGLGKGY